MKTLSKRQLLGALGATFLGMVVIGQMRGNTSTSTYTQTVQPVKKAVKEVPITGAFGIRLGQHWFGTTRSVGERGFFSKVEPPLPQPEFFSYGAYLNAQNQIWQIFGLAETKNHTQIRDMLVEKYGQPMVNGKVLTWSSGVRTVTMDGSTVSYTDYALMPKKATGSL